MRELFEQLAGDRYRKAVSFVSAHDIGIRLGRQGNFGGIAVIAENLEFLRRFRGINAEFFLKLLADITRQAIVPVHPAEFDITVGRDDAEMISVILDEGGVKRSPPQVVDENTARLSVGHFVTELSAMPRVGQGSGGRFIDDVDDIEPGNLAGVLGRLAPRVVEVVRHGDNRVGDRPENSFGVLLEFAQDKRRDKLRGNFMAVERPFVADIPHLPLNPLDNIFGVFHGRAVPVRADDNVLGFGQQNQAGGFDVAVFILNRNRFAVFIDLRQRRKGGS